MKILRFAGFFIFLLMPDLLSAQNYLKKLRKSLIFQDAPFAQCHASTLLETSNGEILAAWFGGTHEGNKDVKIWTSVNRNGKWTFPVELLQMEILVREELFRFGILCFSKIQRIKFSCFTRPGQIRVTGGVCIKHLRPG
jgi:hypothetical protein